MEGRGVFEGHRRSSTITRGCCDETNPSRTEAVEGRSRFARVPPASRSLVEQQPSRTKATTPDTSQTTWLIDLEPLNTSWTPRSTSVAQHRPSRSAKYSFAPSEVFPPHPPRSSFVLRAQRSLPASSSEVLLRYLELLPLALYSFRHSHRSHDHLSTRRASPSPPVRTTPSILLRYSFVTQHPQAGYKYQLS